ncbi:probable inactive ubiquitin carboxyl-terminal hydrolase 54 at C-terminar half [Coccomyxa sp. Obi]|nr:probable inactive ubiquitin carboxyl-terminal hydrolase 54 at C-terminar half [Coccomyxa sp. Obi]
MIKPRKIKAPVSSSDDAVGELDTLRKEAVNENDPKEKLAKIKEISGCTVASSPAFALLMATKLAYSEGIEMLLSMNFETERVKQPFPKGDLTFPFWQLAWECALRGAQEHKSVVCAAIFAELTYIIYGAPIKTYKPMGDSTKKRVEEKLIIIGNVINKCKACGMLDEEREGGPLKGPIGLLMRMDDRCHLLTVPMRMRLLQPQEIAQKRHGAFGDQEEADMAAARKALREQQERSNQVRQELEAIKNAAAERPGKFRTQLPKELYARVQAAFADQQKAAEESLDEAKSAQKPAAKETADEEDGSSLFFAMRTVEPPKLAAAAQRAAELQAKEVKQYIMESYEGLTTEEEKLKKLSSLQEVPASAVLQAIEQEKNRRIEDKAKEAEDSIKRLDESKHAKELLAGWSEAGRPQVVADILAGASMCYPGPLMEEYAESLAAPALEQLCKAQRPGDSDTTTPAVSHDDFIKVAVEGEGLLWEGDLPGEFRAPSLPELNQAIQQSIHARDAEVADSSGAAASLQLAAPRLHPMAPAIAGRSDLAAPLHDRLQRFAEGSSVAADMLKKAPGRSGEVFEDFHKLMQGFPHKVDQQEAFGEVAAAKARGSNPSEADWNVNLSKYAVQTSEGRYARIVHCELKKDSSSSCQENQTEWDPGALAEIGRLRARLLLILRYMLWRLEAYKCRACWDRDTVSEPGAADSPEDLLVGNIKQVCRALRADHDTLLLEYGDLIYAIGPRGNIDEVIPAAIDGAVASRYRFYAAADGPGRACGPANIEKFVLDTPKGKTSSCNAAGAASGDVDIAEDWTAHESTYPLLENGAPVNSIAATATGSGDSSSAAPEAAQAQSSGSEGSGGVPPRKWLGVGPSPSEYPDVDEYERRNPATKEELLQEIFDGLELLRESKLLTPWLVSYLAAIMLATKEPSLDGMDWLQLHWEHMAFLPWERVLFVRDIVFDSLAMNSELLKVSSDVDILLRAHDDSCFALVDGQKDRFHMTSFPLTLPLQDAVLAEQLAAQYPGCAECGPKTEAASKSDKDRNEEGTADRQLAESPASAPLPDHALPHMSQSAEAELAKELVEITKRPEETSMLLTDMLFRTAGRANLLRVPSTYRLKPGAAEKLRARLLRATACFLIAYREKVRLNELRQLAAKILEVHLRFAEMLKAVVPEHGVRCLSIESVIPWMDRVEAARLRLKELGWQEQLQQSEMEMVNRGLPVTILKGELAHLMRERQTAKGTKLVQTPDKDIAKKVQLAKSCEELFKRQQEKHQRLKTDVEQWRRDLVPDSRKKEVLEQGLNRESMEIREESRRVVDHEKLALHQYFRDTLGLAFCTDIRIAAARMAALRILRTCEAELTVCFGERLEKWMVEGLKITLQKAAREHFERRQQANLADLMQAEDKQKASLAKKPARKASKVNVPTFNAILAIEGPAEDAQAQTISAEAPADAGPEDPGKDAAEASAAAEVSSGEGAKRLEDQSHIDTVSAEQSEQWSEAATISAEAAELVEEEQEEQPDTASPAQLSPEVAIETAEAGNLDGFEDVQKKGKKKKKNKKKAVEEVEPESDSATASKWWTFETAAEEDPVDDWQMAKPRRQQQKRGVERGNGPAPPAPAQQEQTNGHSQAPPPSLPQPQLQPRKEVAPQGPPPQSPQAVAVPSPRRVPAGARGDQDSATSRPPWTMGCLKCQDPSHMLANCPDVQGLPSYVVQDMKMALMEGDAQRVQLLLTRPPMQTCHQCDMPGHTLYNCPQLKGMPSRMRDELKLAFVQANVKQKREIQAQWKRMQAERSRAGSVSDRSTLSNESSSARPQPSAQSRAGRVQPPPPLPPGRTTSGPESETWHRQDNTSLNGTHRSSAMGIADAAEETGGRPQPRGAAPDGPEARPQPRGAVAEPSAVRPAPRGVAPSLIPQAQRQPSTPQPSMQAVRAAPSPAIHTYQPPQHAHGATAPVIGVPLPVPLPAQRTSSAPQRSDSADNFSSIMDMLCPQPSPPPSPLPLLPSPEQPAPVRSWAGVAEGEEASAHRRREENDLQAAIQASMHHGRPATALGALVPGPNGELVASSSLTRPQPATPRGSGDAKVLVVATPGLQNQIGEYNCFLNVIIQSLWNCRHFRAPFKAASSAFSSPQSNAVAAAFADLFATFEAEEQQVSSHSVVAPTRLREALDALNPQHFQIGEMSDAAEVLGAIYDSLAEVPVGKQLVEAVFGLHVSEAVHCGKCGRDTHRNTYTQFFHTVPATALRLQAMISGADGALPPLGRLLGDIEAQDQKSCDTDEHGCGERNSIQHLLDGAPPRVFTVQLAWESHCESADAIRDTLSAVHEEVDLAHIYKAQESRLYRLRSMVCYYGAHYHAFVHTEGRWIMFDDANTSVVGDWNAVLHKCQLGKIQPSVLFFEELLGG